jgi:hypothetical protein
MPSGRTLNLTVEVESYGVPGRSFRDLGGSASFDLLDYLDLLQQHDAGQSQADDLLPDGVAESRGRPLLFIVNESRLAQSPAEQEKQLGKLRRKLACRGDRAYLARIRPGELAVVPVSLDDRTPDWKRYRPGTSEASAFFSRLANGQYDGKGEPKEADYVFSAMFKLVWSVADRLATLHLKRADVLSLMGRALFFRFLRDRHVVQNRYVRSIAPKAASILDCFINAENAASTSAWLDKTFNGDLLPLTSDGSANYFEEIGHRTGGRVFFHLSAIIRGEEPSGDKDYQLPLGIPDFGQYDFAHIPVGLLSQVYERFAWKWEHKTARETSVHYTPRNIAAMLVDEAFAKLPNAHAARVLDPACGAGVFLVLAFRRLYQERWRETKQRPNTRAIREILEQRLTGFDISDSAIKLAALSLYLTAIELDSKPVPPERLRFKKLRSGRTAILFNFRREGIDPSDGAVAGSLGEHVGTHFDGMFDLVVSNPPWTRLGHDAKELAAQFTVLSKAIIARKGFPQEAGGYRNPNNVPDLPFLLKATEWCKAEGRIAMALPARFLLKQETIPRNAREVVLRLIHVTGIVNGANLRKTKVWPDMDQPFLLLFAKNCPSRNGRALRFITPQTDAFLNPIGEMRIDAKSTQIVDPESAVGNPSLWKALSIGTTLDVEIVQKICAAGGKPLLKYWEDDLSYAASTGYQVKPRQKKQSPASLLKVLPDLHSPKAEALAAKASCFQVDVTRLNLFSRDKLFRTRLRRKGDKLRVYRAPLTLVRAAPPSDPTEGRALLCLSDVAYNEAYYGYSADPTDEGRLAVRYVQLLAHSRIWLHYALTTSAEIGVERPKFHKADLDGFPLIPLAKLSADVREEIAALSARLLAEDGTVFADIDSFFARIYGLGSLELEVIRDTLEVRDPSDELGIRASASPRPTERERFRKRLESILGPFFKVTGEESQVKLWKPPTVFLQNKAPFGLLLISKRGITIPAPDSLFRETLLRLADDTGSTRIIQQVEGGLLVALLNQYRYWTPSRARLLGAEVVREHLAAFET